MIHNPPSIALICSLFFTSSSNLTDLVLNNGVFASLNDKSSASNIDFLLHDLQLVASGFEQDMSENIAKVRGFRILVSR